MNIDFGRACQDLFTTENKWMTILGLCVCMIIPVAGAMVMFGYLTRRFMREREGKPREDFDFSFFAEYLQIGLWPVLVTLVLSFALVPVMMIVMVPFMISMPVMEDNPGLGVALMILSGILYFVAIIAMTLLFYPVMLRSALTMDFGKGFSWSFIRSFLGKVGLSLLGYYLLLMVMAIPLTFVGYLALIVGAYVVMTWMQFTMHHLLFQHYDLFLARGGKRIEVNPLVTRELGYQPTPPPPLPPGTS